MWKLYSSKVTKFVLIKTNLLFLLPNKGVCFDQYELDYYGRIKFLPVEIPYLPNRISIISVAMFVFIYVLYFYGFFV